MIRILIVEDEAYIRQGIITMLQALPIEAKIVGECKSVKEAVICANTCNPELVFLDVNIIGGSGFDFIEKTKSLKYKVVFITAYEEHALSALKNGAVDYLLKPVDQNELLAAIKKAISVENNEEQLTISKQHYNNNNEKLVLRLQDGFQIIRYDELKYCQSDGGYTMFFLKDGRTFLSSKSIKEFETQMPSESFFRTHQSFIVNLNFVDKYDKRGYVSLYGGGKIEVSFRKRETFIAWLKNH